MTKTFPTYSFVRVSRNPVKFPAGKKNFELVVMIPCEGEFSTLGQVMHALFELKKQYNSSRSMLVIWATNTNCGCDISPAESFWNYFHSVSSGIEAENMFMLEMDFHNNNSSGFKLKTVMSLLKQISFEHCLVYPPARESVPTAQKLHLMVESCRLSRSDLNLAGYVIPFYKGFMVNYWIMPLSYLFGRKVRNAASPDIVFSRNCLNFWMKQNWPDMNYLPSCFLYLTLSAFTSGLKITDYFMGDKPVEILPDIEETRELIKTGLYLVEHYKTFIRNCLMLITCNNKMPPQVPFTIYSTSDMNDILSRYDRYKSYLGKNFPFLVKRNLGADSVETLMKYFRKSSTPDNINEPDDLWNLILLSLVEAFLSSKSVKKRNEIVDIFIHLFSVKPGLWADEIRMMVRTTKDKARHDENRGFPWIGGEAGQYWHIHDSFEKKLHEDLSRLHALKSEFF